MCAAGASVCIDRRNGLWTIYDIPDDETGLPDSPKCAYNRTMIFPKVLSRLCSSKLSLEQFAIAKTPRTPFMLLSPAWVGFAAAHHAYTFFQSEPQWVGAAPGTKCSSLDDYPNKETIRAPGEFQCTLPDELLLTLPIFII